MRRLISLLFVAAASTVPAQAQEDVPHLLPVEVNVGGGYTFSLSRIRQYLGDGYHINVGATLKPNAVFSLQVEYSYNGLGSKQVVVPAATLPSGTTILAPVRADMNMQYGDVNVVMKPKTSGRAKPYVIAGLGLYYRPVTVTAPTAGYVPPYCYPYYYTCFPGGTVVVDQTLASGSATNAGINFGGGIFVLMSREAGGGFYIESRYHYIWGPEVKDEQGVSYGKANGQFLPITIGLRF